MNPQMFFERFGHPTIFPAKSASIRREITPVFFFDMRLHRSLIGELLPANETHVLLTAFARSQVVQQFFIGEKHGVTRSAAI